MRLRPLAGAHGFDACYGGDGKPYETIMELQRRLRCRECDERGKVVVSVRWEMGSAILC